MLRKKDGKWVCPRGCFSDRPFMCAHLREAHELLFGPDPGELLKELETDPVEGLLKIMNGGGR